jgi:hypothetical protein
MQTGCSDRHCRLALLRRKQMDDQVKRLAEKLLHTGFDTLSETDQRVADPRAGTTKRWPNSLMLMWMP